MRHLDIALALIEQEGVYFLQLRGANPEIGGAGLIGCFGGKIEEETPGVAICRELSEETNLENLSEEDIELIGRVRVHSDHKLEKVSVHAHVFRIVVAGDTDIFAKEGGLVRLTPDEAKEKLDNMTTGTRAVFEEIIF